MKDKKLNVLILTAKYGMGHYMVAKSIMQEIEDKANTEIVDFFEVAFPKTQRLIYGAFEFLVRNCSSIYNTLYKITSNTNCPQFNILIKDKIERLIEEKNPDTIVSTFPICSKYISEYMKKNNKNIKLYTYITDINANKEWVADEVEYYFVASEDTKEQIMNLGIPDRKIIISGIPVRKKFKDIECNKEKNEIVIMGGGLGLTPNIKKTLNNLLKKNDIHITLIVGKNKKLLKKYNNKYENLTVIGYTEEIHKYLSKAELIITKAGGITLFESIYSKTPIFVINPFLLQEKGNAKFIENNEIGTVVWNNKNDISEQIIDLLNNKNKIEEMSINMDSIKSKLDRSNVLEVYKGERVNVY